MKVFNLFLDLSTFVGNTEMLLLQFYILFGEIARRWQSDRCNLCAQKSMESLTFSTLRCRNPLVNDAKVGQHILDNMG